MSKPEKYYAPYLSDSDTGYSSDSSEGSDITTTSSGSERSGFERSGFERSGSEPSVRGQALNPPNFRQFASELQLTQASAPSFTSEETVYNRKPTGLQMAVFDAPRESLSNLYIQKDPSGTDIEKTIEFPKQNITSIVMLDSRDRDIKVFPQPTNMSLRLPRPYKNVTNFQIIQIKLLSSFFYFRVDKNNISITIHEQGRFLPPGATSGPLNAITSYIREGTYNINTLITELTTQLNRTPIFYDYPGGFSQFAPLFASTGDYSLNFNQPGDNYYDALNNQFIQSPTMTQIVQKYFQTLNAGFSSYTLNQIKIAYYYPVLKEFLLDRNYTNGLNFAITDTSALLPTETIRSRCIYTFQGINDDIVLQIVDLNVELLDEYRLSNTFRFSLINKYGITYQTNNNRITITSSQLNTSLTNLLNGKFNQFLTEQLQTYGITQTQYNTLSTVNSLLLAILTDMYYYIQRQFAFYFGINFNSYSLPYYTDVFNQIPLQNALNSSGISSNFDQQVIAKNISPQTINELSTFRIQPNYYWNRLNNLSTTVSGFYNMNSNSTISEFSTFGRVWNSLLDRQEPSTSLVRDFTPYASNNSLSSATLYQNKLTHSAEIVTDIEAGQYTTFRFKSPVRQTLRVSAFPRPTQYRYPAYNAMAYDQEKQALFDNSYAFIENAQNARMDVLYASSNLIPVPGFDGSSTYFGSNFTTLYSLWTSNVNLNLIDNRSYFTFRTPKPPSVPPAIAYTFTLRLSVVHTPLTANFASPIRVFLYHDRGAFMADISDVRNEKPLHYKQSALFSNTTIGSLTFTAYSQQTYYCMVRSEATTFVASDFRVVVHYPDGTSNTPLTSTLTGFNPLANPLLDGINYNYASLADSNFLRLPINLLGKNSNNGTDSNFSVFSDNYVKMGYDRNGVSTDLTNYIGYTSNNNASHIDPNAVYRVDPTTGFIVQSITPYDSNAQQYFGAGSSNQLFTSNVLATYQAAPVPQRQTTIAQYYDNVFMMPLPTQPLLSMSSMVVTNRSTGLILGSIPYIELTTVPGVATSNGELNISSIDALVTSLVQRYPLTSQYESIFATTRLSNYSYEGAFNAPSFLTLGNGICGISLIPDDGVWDINRIMLRSAFNGTAADDPNRRIYYLGIYVASYVQTNTPESIELSNAHMVMEFSTAITYNSNLTNFGFSRVPGTYYEWIRSKTFIPRSNQYLNGYAQQISTLNTDSNSFYTILPFTSSQTLVTYTGLSGVPTPYYPFFSFASTSMTYLDGTATPEGTGVVVPVTRPDPDISRGPGSNGYPTQAKYEQSIPITNSVLQYQYQEPFYTNPSSLRIFGPSTFSSNVGQAAFSDSLFRVEGHALFTQGGVYNVYEVKPSSTDMVYKTTLTADLFGVGLSTPQLMGVSGNESEFAFLTMETRNITPNTGGFTDDQVVIQSNNGTFALSNNLLDIGKANEVSVTLFPSIYTISDFLQTMSNFTAISTGITETSNLEFYAVNNAFTLSFLNYPATASLFGFYPRVYTAPALSAANEVISPNAPTLEWVLIGGGSGAGGGPIPVPLFPPLAFGQVLFAQTTPFTIQFVNLATAILFGFDTELHTSVDDPPTGFQIVISPFTAPAPQIKDMYIDTSIAKLRIIGSGSSGFTLNFSGDPTTATQLGFGEDSYASVQISGTFKLTSPNRVNTDIASTFTHRFQIDTYSPSTGTIQTGTPLTPENAFYLPPTPSNYQSILPNYPAYIFSGGITDFDPQVEQGPGDLYSPGTYTTTITNVDSFNYTNKGGYSFGYTVSYTGLSKLLADGDSKSSWPAYEWWGATKATPITDVSTYPYITQPRYIRDSNLTVTDPLANSWCNYDIYNNKARQQFLDIPNNPYGNFHMAFFNSFSELPSGGSPAYPRRDYLRGRNPYEAQKIETELVYVDFTDLSFNQVVPDTVTGFLVNAFVQQFPIVQPWGREYSVLSTLMKQSVFPRINNVDLLLKDDLVDPPPPLPDGEPQPLPTPPPNRTYCAIAARGNGTQQQLMLAYDFTEMVDNAGLPSTTYYQYVEQTVSGMISDSMNYIFKKSSQVIQSYTESNLFPYDIKGGANGSFWVTMNEGNRIDGNEFPYASVWGNRNNVFDAPTSIKNAYQIFYPTQRIVMTKVKRAYDPMTDLSGILYPEWPHTNMFAYNSYSNYVADISANKWGLEQASKYMVADTQFSGTNYNAACLNIPLAASSNYYYLAVRGYSPTEKSQVMMRFSLPNQHDFGYATFADISNEIFLYPSSIGTFNSNYGNTLLAFNSNFVFDSNGRAFGSNIIQGYNGSNFSNITGFGDFLQEFIAIYNVYNSNVQLLTQINTAIQSNINAFITTDLAFILPPNALQRQRYTDPIIYSILWKTALPQEYTVLEDNWGLGWNLGYEKEDTPYDTTHVAQSFYKILDDFINLKLNQEFDMNRIDTGAKENLSATLEPTGSLKAYYGKLLLAPFGSYAQTIISNPVSFQLPIPRIEKMTFTWTDTLGVTINNADCEWNVVIQIVESIEPGKPAQPPRIMPR
jgi:hypothetical protein